MTRIFALLLCFGFFLPSAAPAALWTDALGREVRVPDKPLRIVSLVPSVTEILFALGLEDRIVGVTRFCNFPPEARTKPQVGGYSDPSIEAVVAQKPDLVFMAADAVNPVLLKRLEALDITAFVVYPRSLSGALQAIEIVANVAGASDAGLKQTQLLRSVIEEVKRASVARKKPRVLLCVMVHPLTVAGPETLANDLVEAAGGVNVIPAGRSRYPTWGPEAVLAADPDVIVVSPHPGEEDPAEFFQKWKELRAVSSGRVVAIESDWIQRPGPRLALGLKALAEAFNGIDSVEKESPCPR